VATAKGLKLTIDAPNEPVRFTSDPAKVRQVLVNLLSNVIKFTDEGGISLASRAEDGRVVFEVDTGIGIAPEHQEQVFETFWQVDQTATRKRGGAGLGLSVSRRLARALGGDLTVESAIGNGSRFRFWVPRWHVTTRLDDERGGQRLPPGYGTGHTPKEEPLQPFTVTVRRQRRPKRCRLRSSVRVGPVGRSSGR
jgi:signal transduction histidine kinase